MPTKRPLKRAGGKRAAKAKAKKRPKARPEPKMIELAPSPLGLGTCDLSIDDVTAETDSDGDVSLNVKYTVTNNTSEDWEYLAVRAQVLRGDGVPLEETRDTQEQTIAAGESNGFEAYLRFNAKTLGGTSRTATILMSATACGAVIEPLDQFDVPTQPFEMVELKPVQLGDQLRLISGSLLKREPDSDGDVSVEVRALVQSLTAQHLLAVTLLAKISDKAMREITDATVTEEVRAGEVCVLSGSGYTKDKRLKDAKVALSIRAYYPLATGHCQHGDVEVPEASEEEEALNDESNHAEVELPEGSGVDICSIKIAFGSWAEIRSGELPQLAVDQILSGSDFDSTIEELLGERPDGLPSILPNAEWVLFGKTVKEIADQASRFKRVSKVEWRGQKIEPMVQLVIKDDADLPEDSDCVCKIDSLRLLLDPAAADEVAALWAHAIHMQTQIVNKTVSSEASKRPVLWAWMDTWKGCWAVASAKFDGEAPPNVVCIYFSIGEVLPRIMSLVDDEGERASYYFQAQFSGYLACIVIGNKVLMPQLSEDRDSGFDRFIIDYRKGSAPTVLFST